MPIYKMSSHERREQRYRLIEKWAKWVAILLSATLLATTFLLLHMRRSSGPAIVAPRAVELAKPVATF